MRASWFAQAYFVASEECSYWTRQVAGASSRRSICRVTADGGKLAATAASRVGQRYATEASWARDAKLAGRASMLWGDPT
jgi:hypothetical protein